MTDKFSVTVTPSARKKHRGGNGALCSTLLLPIPRMRLAKGLFARRIGAVTTQFIKERVGLPKHS
jgi:hypothetical protein